MWKSEAFALVPPIRHRYSLRRRVVEKRSSCASSPSSELRVSAPGAILGRVAARRISNCAPTVEAFTALYNTGAGLKYLESYAERYPRG